MKALIILMTFSVSAQARELIPFDATYLGLVKEEMQALESQENVKALYLTKALHQQKMMYEEKIAYLESELKKTKDRLLEKSLMQEKMNQAMEEKYSHEARVYKQSLAHTTRTLMEYQRQMEKMKPSEDLKNMIRLNTQLASELRKSEDQIAIIQLKGIEAMPGLYNSKGTGVRMPASVQEK